MAAHGCLIKNDHHEESSGWGGSFGNIDKHNRDMGSNSPVVVLIYGCKSWCVGQETYRKDV